MIPEFPILHLRSASLTVQHVSWDKESYSIKFLNFDISMCDDTKNLIAKVGIEKLLVDKKLLVSGN